MYPASFEYHRAGSVDEAVALLGQYGEDAKLLAGGHSLIPLMKLRFTRPGHLIDVRKIPGLASIREESNAIVIGAGTTHRQLATSSVLWSRLPIVAEAAAVIGDPLVRNMGTIGGSLAHADPGADLPAVMLAVGAELVLVGPTGRRSVKADDFFVGLLATAIKPNEVLTEIRIPVPVARSGGAYEKFPHAASRYAVIGAAAVVRLGDASVVASARVAITGLGTHAARAAEVEQAVTGRAPSESTVMTAASRAAEGIEMRADSGLEADYRRELAAVYVKRALLRAVERAKE
jgi:aerobic carbon-monoxide dehydrogenase medium subunit